MNRRKAFKNIAIGAGSLIILPLWMESCGISDGHTHMSSFSSGEQDILAAMADTLIPPGNKIGALSVGVDKFLQKLIDDCYEKPVQDNVKKQLNALQVSADEVYGKSFISCSQQQRQDMLLKISVSQNKDQKLFYDLVKSETIRGFNTSQQVMEGYLDYKVAPGHYFGCVNVKS